MTVTVYIACSLDGYIADRDNNLQWLMSLPNPDGGDFGYAKFMNSVDSILMGRRTFEFVEGFDQWPYTKPVFVASTSRATLPEKFEGRCTLVSGSPRDILTTMERAGCRSVYVDGGNLITRFLEDDLVDQMIITRTSQLLGAGYPLFGSMTKGSIWTRVETIELNAHLVQTRYRRDRAFPAGITTYTQEQS